jgi:ubiquinone/menaquinone biosynthesis C-methylase UbiE
MTEAAPAPEGSAGETNCYPEAGEAGEAGVSLADLLRRALGGISGGRVLDVGTGEGGSLGLLATNLQSYTELVGVDLDTALLRRARDAFDGRDVHLACMDAERLAFADQCYDAAAICASLHHLADVPRVLAEMRRLLKPGGRLIVIEMHCGGDTGPQCTAVDIHHWAAAVDTSLGLDHHPTLAHQQILDAVAGQGFCDLACYDWSDTSSDPMDQELIAQVTRYVERFIERAHGSPDGAALVRRGEELLQRLRQTGVQREPVLILVGRTR